MRVLTLNVCGLRASQKKGLFSWLKRQKADYICLQEVRASEKQIESNLFSIAGYARYSSVAEKKGYSGVALYMKYKPDEIIEGFGQEKYDVEGRVIGARYQDTIVFSVYFPNGQRDEERLQYKLDFYTDFFEYCNELKTQGYYVIVTGDLKIVPSAKAFRVSERKKNRRVILSINMDL